MARILVVSNRLPITMKKGDDGIVVERSSGGLATGLGAAHESSGGLWIGWPGLADELGEADAAAMAARFRELRVVPVTLSAREVEGFYEGYCNGLLWPLFHSFLGQLPLDVPGWSLYQAANARFADAVVASYREGDLIWIHDYQLMLLPRMIRDRIPKAHWLLPPHSVSGVRHVPDSTHAQAPVGGPAGSGSRWVPHGRVHAKLRVVGAAGAWLCQ
jgi:trehalose 6-phosphate synthase/phosphatase